MGQRGLVSTRAVNVRSGQKKWTHCESYALKVAHAGGERISAAGIDDDGFGSGTVAFTGVAHHHGSHSATNLDVAHVGSDLNGDAHGVGADDVLLTGGPATVGVKSVGSEPGQN